MKKKSDFGSVTFALCSLIIIIPWQVLAAGDMVKRVIDKTKYVDQYFEVDQNGNFKVHIYLGDKKIATTDNQELYFNVDDHLNSPTIVTDQSGEVVETNDYDDYGNIVHSQSAIDNSYKFTGKELDAATGLQYFGQRYYDSNVSHFTSIDPLLISDPYTLLSDPQKLNSYSHVYNNPIKYTDPTGESGELTIYSNLGYGDSSDRFFGGHSWITYTPDSTNITTSYGTWGNHPNNQNNGLLKNMEFAQGLTTGDFSRTTHIDDEREEKLYSTIEEYGNRGETAWKIMAPCSAFAQDAWSAGTGEYLNANTSVVNRPGTLSESIFKANGNNRHGVLQVEQESSFLSKLYNSIKHVPNFIKRVQGNIYRGSGNILNPIAQRIYNLISE